MELWQRFTTRARRAVLLAHSEATGSRARLIGTEHLLLGLLRLGEGTAIEVLGRLGANVDRLHGDLEQQMTTGREEAEGDVPREAEARVELTTEACQALRIAHAAARALGDPQTGIEHLLLGLGLLRLGEDRARQVLEDMGADVNWLRRDMDLQPSSLRADATGDEVRFAPEAQRTLQAAYTEARVMGDLHIGTEHVLLGLLRLGEGPACRALESHGVKLEAVRSAVAAIPRVRRDRGGEAEQSGTTK